ncbi:Methylated-DNA--protein-cysteine methyltransferase, constitutive [Pedobacter sp. Bi27]|uniref:methylated-DNA--[protein]-cysteine S-methyltransferase n=1 Tax=unclassified Pedobacter TaxID=2628915 RepID=UPI001D4A1491|nr:MULTISPECIES: methylated-DNA--[protein]-cysteine S-methyltransferase [unclassified Pedobacter]CAH0153649.1 Methylated-DNA--protein-cysteine methyltransferase, constitutive [Pedobacter sp. Bi126]CAH0154089.1 Methylated-DNA--protein-cysteine methyltransferase, constitutive [Pedobacter sp. Bi27]CAH0204693.1 Methylated-DNA--protein-cysteine methyltransferase, constitutive [Pedobacter sp. Bi36]
MNYASVIASPVGTITILADDEFVHVITFAEKDITGLSENALTAKVAKQLNDYFKGDLKTFDFPLKQKGTEFQQEVWQNLLTIPFGETTSYAKFSAHNPLAIRAIAAANGKNNIAVVVPCHRVIGSNGKLVGYAGGLWRKQWLLQHEREVAQKGQTELKF